jgi:hypothetical protein
MTTAEACQTAVGRTCGAASFSKYFTPGKWGGSGLVMEEGGCSCGRTSMKLVTANAQEKIVEPWETHRPIPPAVRKYFVTNRACLTGISTYLGAEPGLLYLPSFLSRANISSVAGMQ